MTLDLACAEIRLATPEDAPELTALLPRAYASLGEMGLCFMAVDQSEAATLRRMARGECYLATAGYRLLGTILFAPPAMTHGSPWLDRPGVASLHQFAVEPALQRSGLGSRLMAWAESRARDCGAAEIALDTAEPAIHLRAWYASRGYREIEFAQWQHTNYRSIIMSKPLNPRDAAVR